MATGYVDIQRGMRVLFAALLVFAFVTPVCVTMTCSMVGMAPTATDMSHMSGMSHGAVGGTADSAAATSNHANHTSFGDCMRGFTSHSGLIGTDGLTLAAILIAIALMGLATSAAPLTSSTTNSWSAPLRAPSPPPPRAPLGVRLSV